MGNIYNFEKIQLYFKSVGDILEEIILLAIFFFNVMNGTNLYKICGSLVSSTPSDSPSTVITPHCSDFLKKIST